MCNETNIVECNFCGWLGTEDKLIIRASGIEFAKSKHCPNCNDSSYLVENGFTVKKSS